MTVLEPTIDGADLATTEGEDAQASVDEAIVEEVLVEEISIDGMCGVY